MSAKQVKVSIPTKEWDMAEKTAEKQHYDSTTGYIRHLIRLNCTAV